MYKFKQELSKEDNRPLLGILALAFVLYLIGIDWGLPHTISWQSDTLAPMRPLKGMFSLYSFGYFHKYPYVHSFILSILNAPIVAVYGVLYLLEGGALDPAVFAEAIQNSKPLATVLIIEDRLIGIAFALGLVFNVFLIARRLFNRQAGFFAALFVVLNQGTNHLAHVAKVDIPHLFWGTLAIYALMLAVQTTQRKYYVYSAILSGLTYGTKDQGYSLFVLPFLLVVVFVPLWKDLRNRHWTKTYWGDIFVSFAVAFWGTFIIVENLVFNWSGFLMRIEHLTGDAGFRSAAYPETFLGNLGMIWDAFWQLNALVTPVFTLFLIIGIVMMVKTGKKGLFYTLLLWVCLSYYLTFLMVVRQTMPRFIVTISVFLAPYGGYGAEIVFRRYKKIVLVSLVFPLLNALLINFTLLKDPRYEMERFIEQEVKPGSRVEYYSFQQYVTRFSQEVDAYVVKSPPENFYDLAERDPEYILLTSMWYTRYMEDTEAVDTPFRYGVVDKMRTYEEQGYEEYYNNLLMEKSGYHVLKRVDAHPLIHWVRSLKVPDHLILLRRDSNE